jgi:hypothetical protein
MNESIKIPFSKSHGFFGTIVTLFFIFQTLPSVILNFKLNQTTNYIIGTIFEMILFTMLFFVLVLYLLPAIRGKAAIEMNENGIHSKVRNINLTWDKIKDVRFYSLRYSGIIAIDLIDEDSFKSEIKNPFKKFSMWYCNSFYLTPLVIPTMAIQGNDGDIFQAVKNYLYQVKKYT